MAEKTTERFAEIMHDLRNAVAVVLLCAEFIEKSPAHPSAAARITLDEAIADMRQSCRQIEAAIDRLRKWKEERDG